MPMPETCWLTPKTTVSSAMTRPASAPTAIAATQPEPQTAGEIGGGEADHGAEQHDALDAEIEHAGALVDELAEGGEEQRRRDADDRREEADLEDLGDGLKHGAPPCSR